MSTKHVKKRHIETERGGARTGAGRPQKPDKATWAQVTCTLRRDTIDELRSAGGGKFGQYLQAHLDRYPLPGQLLKLARKRPAKVWNLRNEKDAKAFERAYLRAKVKNGHHARKIEPRKPVAN